jgi:hypothetical protein
MGKKSGSAPQAPDPVATARAQTTQNIETARKNAELNRVNSYSPFGSLTYSKADPIFDQAGFDQALASWQSNFDKLGAAPPSSITQPSGRAGHFSAVNPAYTDYQKRLAALGKAPTKAQFTSNTDQWQQNFNLDPKFQPILDALTSNLQAPFDYEQFCPNPNETDFSADAQRVEQATYDRAMNLLRPQFEMDEERLQQRLVDQGLGNRNAAGSRELDDFSRRKGDVLTNLGLDSVRAGRAEQSRLYGMATDARARAIAEALQERLQPLNEASALFQGSPAFQVQAPGTQVMPTDLYGPINTAYQGSLDNYNQRIATNNANMSGIYGLGAAGLIAF